ncbi:MAG: NADH-quinone oxidoreductase subunit L [Bacteroidetes bacterium]|nr:NADH-quinone oxidoreductase subunit L [Bacteroidota bacterium]
MYQYVGLIVLFPLIGLLVNGLFGRKIKSESIVGIIGSGAVGLSFLVAAAIFIEMLGMPAEDRAHTVTLFTWIAAGSLTVSAAYLVDQLSILMTLVVTGVGFLIHVYSIGYMHGDRGFWRFFTYLNLFIFAMLNLVLADNYLLMFLGWEGVGLCSYLLIGFWYDKKFEGVKITWTGDAANKAFWVNRIGDFAFMIGMFLIFREFGTLTFNEVMGDAGTLAVGNDTVFWITLLLFLGATGKSAQIPLFVWLPDAMAGPTPVSALIHAATMVTAGVYMVARNSALYALAPDTMMIVAIGGAITAIMAASIGLAQNDIKKVLAYSTVSQLGFMFLALGVGAYTAAIFHVMTHAFFKACLFLGSGSVIHAMHEEQDIRHMGGLKKIMPYTYWTFLISSFAIAGFPPLSGFFSKDEILWKAFADGSPVLWVIGATAALMTAFYMFRMVTLTFGGEPRWAKDKHPHESPASMTIPLIVLAALAVVGGFVGVPAVLGGGNAIEQWLHPLFAQAHNTLALPEHTNHATEYLLMAISVAIAVTGFWFGRSVYMKNPEADRSIAARTGVLYRLLANKYYVDNVYHAGLVTPIVKTSDRFLFRIFDVRIIDGFVNGLARTTGWVSSVLRYMQTGVVQNYAALIVLGIVVVLGLLIFS